jgi:hypothetical protein
MLLFVLAVSGGLASRQIPKRRALPNTMTISKIAAFAVFVALFSVGAFADNPVPPQGRLTLTSNTPVMTGDVVGASTVYYTPYQGSLVPIYGGTAWTNYQFGQLTLTLNSLVQTAGTVYDVFVFLNSGTPTLGINASPWPSSSSRGTLGAAISTLNGIWVNTRGWEGSYFFLYNGGTEYTSIEPNQATYLGSIYITANGETSMQFKPASATGGSNSVLGLYNAYNRVPVSSRSVDSTLDWTDTSNAWRAADNNDNNRITYLDGLQQSFVFADYWASASETSGTTAAVGILEDATTGNPPGLTPSLTGLPFLSFEAKDNFTPLLGLHYLQAVEYSSGSTSTFYGIGEMLLQITLEM